LELNKKWKLLISFVCEQKQIGKFRKADYQGVYAKSISTCLSEEWSDEESLLLPEINTIMVKTRLFSALRET